jgi:predicted ATPase
VTFVVLRGADQHRVAQLAVAHADFAPDRRRVLIDDGTFHAVVPPGTAALTLRVDGSISVVLNRERALSEPWIEDGFLRASRDIASLG